MNPTLQTGLAFLAAVLIGGLVNIGLIVLGPQIITPPPGVDMADMNSFAAAVDSMGPQHFLFPFLAHALGTFSGCVIVARLAVTRRQFWTYSLGIFFLFGGISAAATIPAPLWFVLVDLILAYLPMAWLALKISKGENGVSIP